ncbi:GNAT family N-acetyltransferase [Luedemannella flava]
MREEYEVRGEVPGVGEYRRLREAAGLSPKGVEAAEKGLPNTWCGVTVRRGGEAVGMGRIVGDGGCFFQVVDICVLPEHQGRGLGKLIMRALLDEYDRRAPASAYLSLIADGDAQHLYRQFGFVDTAPASVGMFRQVKKIS